MPKIYIRAKGYLTVNGLPFSGCLECGADEDILVASCPGEGFLPNLFVLRVRRGALLPCPQAKIVFWGKAAAEVFPAAIPYLPPAPPVPRLCRELKCAGKAHLVTVFTQGGYFFTVETEEETFTHAVPLRQVDGLDVFAENCGGGSLIFLFFRGEKHYAFCLFYDGDYRPVAKCVCADAKLSGGRLLLTHELRDMRRLAVTEEYDLFSGKARLLSRSFSYRTDPAACPDLLLPYAYAESAVCGDEDACRRLSRADMFAVMSGCVALAEPPHLRTEKYQTALLRPCAGGYSAELYAYEVDGLINAVRRVPL